MVSRGRGASRERHGENYDPTTGQLRNSSPDAIARWFIDTDYNGESFFVRPACFTGGDAVKALEL